MSEQSAAQLPDDGQAGPDQVDQRAAQRFTLLIRNAKIVYPCGEFLCVIRDVSSTGVRIKTFQLVQEHIVEMQIELTNTRNFLYRTCWKMDNGIPVNNDAAMLKRFEAFLLYEQAHGKH